MAHIPESLVAPLSQVSRFSEEQFNSAILFLDEITAEGKIKADIDDETLVQYNLIGQLSFDLLLGFFRLDEDMSSFVVSIARQVVLFDTNLDEGQVRDRITQILNIKPILINAKVAALSKDSERLFINAKFSSSIKPIFIESETGDDTDEQTLAAAFISHNLVLEFSEKNERSRLLLDLDSSDIRHLQELCTRALNFQNRLSEDLRAKGLKVIDPFASVHTS